MALADLWDWVFAGMFDEDAVSETKTRGLNTPWDRMSNAIHVGRIQIVVAVDLGRLLRTTRDLLTLTDAGADAGAGAEAEAKVITLDS